MNAHSLLNTLSRLTILQLRVHFSLLVLVHLADSQVKEDVLTPSWDLCTLYLSCNLGHELSLSDLDITIAVEEYLSTLSAFVQDQPSLGLGQSRQATQFGIGLSFFEMTHLVCKGPIEQSVR